MFDVGEVGAFDDAVHVAEREGDESGGCAFADVIDGVGVGAAVARGGFVLERDGVFVGGFDEPLDDERVAAGAVGDGGTAAEFDGAVFGFFDAGGVGGVGDVEADGDVWLETVGEHAGAVAADFFLDAIGGDDGAVEFFAVFVETAEGFGDDEAADAVIEGAADEAVGAEVVDAVGVDGWVADAEAEFGDVFFGICADIDVEFVDFGGFFTAGAIADVDGGVADDAGDWAEVALEDEFAATGGGVVAAADSVDVEVAFFGDGLDHEADFVGMGFEHDFEGGFAFESGPCAAVSVAGDGVCGGFDPCGPFALAGHFEAGGAWGIEEVEEEGFGGFVHGGVRSWTRRRREASRITGAGVGWRGGVQRRGMEGRAHGFSLPPFLSLTVIVPRSVPP